MVPVMVKDTGLQTISRKRLIATREATSMTKRMAKVSIYGKMEPGTKELSIMTSSMVRVPFTTRMGEACSCTGMRE